VSILHPGRVSQILDIPKDWHLVAYLCLGLPEEEHLEPELVRAGWQDRADVSEFILRR
jgi:5,6-dimethylbenzimidazole synthase